MSVWSGNGEAIVLDQMARAPTPKGRSENHESTSQSETQRIGSQKNDSQCTHDVEKGESEP